MTSIIAVGLILLQMAVALAASDNMPPGVRFDERFTLGPYIRDIMPVPIELSMHAAAVAVEGWFVEEQNATGEEIARFPGHRIDGESTAEHQQVFFIPWTAPDSTVWQAGNERHFVMRDSAVTVQPRIGEFVSSSPDELVLSNRHYVVTLAPVTAAQSGPATIIRSITFSHSGKVFRPNNCFGELTVDGRRYFTRFDLTVKPLLTQSGQDCVQVTYGGGFYDGKEPLPGVTWRMTLTGYADLPLIKVRMERRQKPEALASGRCTFQGFLKMTFNGRDPSRHPFETVRQIPRSSFDRHRDLLAAEGPGACLAILLPDGRTYGTCYYIPEKTSYAFVCMEHESKHTIRSQDYRPELDIREGYLLATSDVAFTDRLIETWWSLHQLLDVNERLQLRRLFNKNDRF